LNEKPTMANWTAAFLFPAGYIRFRRPVPNALAMLVQRRIDESMNWRAHDSESEYT
jgi:hypothetical protein